MQESKPLHQTPEAIFTAAVVNELSAELQKVLQVLQLNMYLLSQSITKRHADTDISLLHN